MLRLFAIATLLVGGSVSANAQSFDHLSVSEKRQLHVPFVRALTDCFAAAIRQNDRALAYAAYGQLDEAVKGISMSCKEHADRMAAAHDQIYGRGTGIAFGMGPYAEDLPRALQSRLQPDIDRKRAEDARLAQARQAEAQRIEIERLSREQQTRDAEAARTKLMASVMNDFGACLTKAARELAILSQESASDISTAALVRCKDHEQKLMSLGPAMYGMTEAATSKKVDDLRAKQRDILIAEVVQVRADLTKALLNSPAPKADDGVRPALKNF